MHEIISEKTADFIKVKGPELIKTKFPGISLEVPSDEISERLIYQWINDDRPYDKIIESLVEIKQPGVRIPKSYSQMKKIYGEDTAFQLLKAQQNGELTAELFGSILDTRENNKAETTNASSHRGKAKTNNGKPQYVPMPFELIDNPEFKKFFKGQYLTYAILRRYIVRKPFKYDRLDLYENYFQKGQLASSCSIGWLATGFECSPNTIRKHMRKLKNKGCIKVDPVRSKDAWDNQKHNIYILGTIDGEGNQKFYIDDAFNIPAIPWQGVQ